ncbi:MAG TPA: hypothetical protein DDX39_11190 [Bacteroidales bacterium]|nr:MAG: hypothetical protein A2W98_13785 [Bacteroidetes bacterium GWF2_33_38]OFY73275.1 MAG: hypothetical protein A2265_09300 [Bacteroidetes bacterium RIFOXYA12_FULL_33_9]OFY90980.1 MAG: hypothetical protein A2236_03420 [Bacteroidetes bacterium RIFOXYA2_FULL_33_7]HBF89196.1 hypothetical protein [Bacteroidales bacterium]
MKKILFLFVCVLFIGTALTKAQKLDKFGADMGKKEVMGKEVRVPYTDVISYFGYVKPGAAPDETKGGKKYYYLYVWIPAVAPEIGVRMISPVPDKMVPEKTDYVAQDFDIKDKTNYFDTWISLERADGITSVDDILAKSKSAKWNLYDQNDDSGEMPAQPSGSKYNSLMRITSNPNDPLKALVVGLYRIGFTTYKVGEVQGSFMAQVGAPVKLPGVAVAKDVDSLVKLLKEAKE